MPVKRGIMAKSLITKEKKMRNVSPSIKIKAVTCAMAFLLAVAFQQAHAQTAVTPAQARAIAREAYIYANPLADSYRIMYSSFVDRTDPEYKTPLNQLKNFARVYTPDDKKEILS